jgi:hypothetical protein
VRSFFVLEIKVKLFLAQGNWHNCVHKMLVKLTPGLEAARKLNIDEIDLWKREAFE